MIFEDSEMHITFDYGSGDMPDETGGDTRIKRRILFAALMAEAESIVISPIKLWPRIASHVKTGRFFTLSSLHRPVMRLLLASSFVLLGLATLILWLPASPTSAAQVIERSISLSTKNFEEGEFLYERFLVVIPQGSGGTTVTATAELWQSFDGRLIRYEVVRWDRKLVMFRMHNDGQLWQSLHLATPGLEEADAILYVPTIEEGISYPFTLHGGFDPSDLHSPFRKGLLYALPEIDRLILTYRPVCAGITCLLREIESEEEDLILRLKDESGQARILHSIDVIDKENPDIIRNLRIDAENYAFTEYVDQQGNHLHLLDHQVLSEKDLHPDLFTSLPENVRVISVPEGWNPNVTAQGTKSGRLWVISTTPEPGAIIGGWLEVTMGYELVSQPLSGLSVYLMPYYPFCETRPGECASGTIGGDQTIVVAGEGSVTLHFTLEAWHRRGQMVLMAQFSPSDELQSFEEYVWSASSDTVDP
jgi:hypothetical protein